jgi:Zn-dependent peptidase ImmA (M78 family)
MRKSDRIQQVTRWLSDRFPAPYPVEVRVTKMKMERDGRRSFLTFGDCQFSDRKFRIRIESRHVLSVMIDTLLHEYAHAVAHPHRKLWDQTKDHGPEFAIAWGKIYSAFQDEGGGDESRDY